MAIQFPESLPCFSAKYSYAQKNTITKTEFQSGFTRNRRRFRDVPVTFPVMLENITDEQLAVFEAWRYYEVEDVNWFNATLKTGEGLQDWSVRFNGTGETKSYSEGYWTLGFTVEAKKNKYLDEFDYYVNNYGMTYTFGTDTQNALNELWD